MTTDIHEGQSLGDLMGTGGALRSSEERIATAAVAMALPDVEAAEERPRLLCVGLGHLKDGRHVAFEAEVEGGKVLEWRPLCAHTHVSGPERAWWQVAYAKLYVRRELSETEQAANVRDTRGVLPEHFEHGLAVSIHTQGKKTAALAMRLEGLTVTEPEVLTVGPRDFIWNRIDTWVGLNMMPRRKM